MGVTSLILGILSTSGVCLSFIPFLNLANCLILPLALVGAIFGIVGLFRPRGRGLAIAGLVLNGLALLIGAGRVVISCLAGACIV